MPTSHRENLLDIYQSALAAVNGRVCVQSRLAARPMPGNVYLIALGKAACAMTLGAYDVLGGRVADALIVTKRGYAVPLPWPVWEAGHPLVDETSLEAGKQLLAFVDRIPQQATVLVLLSGGASALVEALPPEISFDRFQKINRWVLASGLNITNYNRIRRRMSRIKGGRLAKLLFPRQVVCLIISDVPDNDLRAIGSGPLVADEELRRPFALKGLPDFLTEVLPYMPLAPEPNDVCFRNINREIIATLDNAKTAALEAAKKLGYMAKTESGFIAGDAVEAGTSLAKKLLQSEPGVMYVWGGETTVALPESPGRGGRNQSLALAAALVLHGQKNAWLLPWAPMAVTARPKMPARWWMAQRLTAVPMPVSMPSILWRVPMPEHIWKRAAI